MDGNANFIKQFIVQTSSEDLDEVLKTAVKENILLWMQPKDETGFLSVEAIWPVLQGIIGKKRGNIWG